MRLKDNRVAGNKVGRDGRVGIPAGKGRAAHDQRQSAGNEVIALLEGDARIAQFPRPGGPGRDVRHGLVRVGDGFHPAVQGICAAADEAHHERLTGRVHGGIRVLEQALFE